MEKTAIKHLTSLAILLLSGEVSAFTSLSPDIRIRHEGFVIEFLANIPDLSNDGLPLNQGFADAAFMWSMKSPVTVNVTNDYNNPCDGTPIPGSSVVDDGINSIDMIPDICGVKLFANALAVGLIIAPNGKISNSDIVFSDEFTWGIYDGPIKFIPSTDPDNPFLRIDDFRRTSLHEIGHSLGLNHSIFQSSIMSMQSSDIFTLSPDDICGISIFYEEPESCTILLGQGVTASGASTTATFSGGSSSDEGQTYKSNFMASEEIDVMVTVVVDESDAGHSGNIHVIAVLPDGSLMGMNQAGGFESFGNSLPSAVFKTLAPANELFILKDFTPADFDVSGLSVSFFVGYSLSGSPSDIHYGSEPITLAIE
ncbi:MAG: matrixin family metalloprotease [Gammaproteobacteria bacterium]|nr:matrixin family metalloprotease [Gammaproteobacteria bacterium]